VSLLITRPTQKNFPKKTTPPIHQSINQNVPTFTKNSSPDREGGLSLETLEKIEKELKLM